MVYYSSHQLFPFCMSKPRFLILKKRKRKSTTIVLDILQLLQWSPYCVLFVQTFYYVLKSNAIKLYTLRYSKSVILLL